MGAHIKNTLMNKLFFAESKLISYRAKSAERIDDVDQAAEGIHDGTYRDTREAQRVMLEQSKLKSRLAESDIFSDEDKKQWAKRLEEAKQKAVSAEEMKDLAKEFEKQQGAIKGMVETYTQKVMSSREAAFTIDSSRNLDTAKDYVEWFAKQSYEEKVRALNTIDTDIAERQQLRRKLLERFDKKDVIKLRRSEMRDKVKELEQMEKNEGRYAEMMKGNERYFHDPNEYLNQFKDKTLEEQERWMTAFNEEYLKPRKALVEIYDRLPDKYKDDSKFLKVGRKEKIAFLEKLDVKLEQSYIKQVNEVKTEVMSQNSKRFAIVDFLRLKDVAAKAMWLEQLPKSIKAEEKFAKKYKEQKKELTITMPGSGEKVEISGYSEKEWNNLSFENKESLLKNMAAEIKLKQPFLKIINEAVKDGSVSKKTADRYLNLFAENNISGRSQLCRNILTSMKIRRDLVKDFEQFDEETKNKFKSFYERGHKARMQIYQEAKLFESKKKTQEEADTKEEEEKKETPKALESEQIEKIIEEFHKDADEFEAKEEYERCLDKHEDVLKLHPQNEYSLKKISEINKEIQTIDTIMDKDIQEAVAREAKTGSIQEELDRIALAEMLRKDREEVITYNRGVENLGKQTTHLSDDSFDRNVQRKIYETSGGKQMLDEEGRVTEIEDVDLKTLGKRDKSDIRYYRDRLRSLKNDDNLTNIRFVDQNSGRELRIDEATKQLDKRKMAAAKAIAGRVKGMNKTDAQKVLLTASQLIENQV
jgi:hypothetical protein